MTTTQALAVVVFAISVTLIAVELNHPGFFVGLAAMKRELDT